MQLKTLEVIVKLAAEELGPLPWPVLRKHLLDGGFGAEILDLNRKHIETIFLEWIGKYAQSVLFGQNPMKSISPPSPPEDASQPLSGLPYGSSRRSHGSPVATGETYEVGSGPRTAFITCKLANFTFV
jgi:hypothetical protein